MKTGVKDDLVIQPDVEADKEGLKGQEKVEKDQKRHSSRRFHPDTTDVESSVATYSSFSDVFLIYL